MNVSVIVWLLLTALGTLALMSSAIFISTFKSRRVWADLAAGAYIVGGIFLISETDYLVLREALFVIQIWLVVIALRVHMGRIRDPDLRYDTAASVGLLTGFSALGVVILLWLQTTQTPLSVGVYIWSATIFSFVWGAVAFGQLLWSEKRFRPSHAEYELDPHNIPTVTLAMAARNEDHALLDSLHSAIASDYPKLEILVLDDSSQDKTSSIIESLAKDGIRFIPGPPHRDDWVGKTQSMQALAEHASGDYIIYCNTDTRLYPRSIGRVIGYMQTHHIGMVSILPQRLDGVRGSTLFQTLRYYFQIAMPAYAFRTPVSSAVWCINAATLHELGGFAPLKHKVIPEGHFARKLHRADRYRFTISNEIIGVTMAKKWSSQIATALRISYPTCKRQPVLTLLASTALIFLLTPYFYTLASIWFWPLDALEFATIITSILLSAGFAQYLSMVSPQVTLSGFLTFPLLLAQELIITVASMLLYEFGKVVWKGRDVSPPVLNQHRYKKEEPATSPSRAS